MSQNVIQTAAIQPAPPPTVSPTAPNRPGQAIQNLAFYRIWQILGNKKATPPVEPLLPISRSSFYEGIRAGIYPAPVKIFGGRVSVWRCEDIHALLEALGQGVTK